jgi:hypothetical protein
VELEARLGLGGEAGVRDGIGFEAAHCASGQAERLRRDDPRDAASATCVVIASQDPLSVPRAIVELTSILVLQRMTSPQWLKHLRSAIVPLDNLPDGAMTSLQPGEALVWSQRSTDKRFTLRPQKVSIRPRFTQHGGGTKTAVDGAAIR